MPTATTYKPERLEAYKRPDSYAGPDYVDNYVFIGQHRDSDTMSRSNFIVAQQRLKDITDESETTWQVIRDSHWAVGWIETIYIHKSAFACLEAADTMLEDMESYPALSEDHRSELEYTEITEYYESQSLEMKIGLCVESGESIFAARRLPESVYDSLRDSWD